MPEADATKPEMQVRLVIGELVVTIAHLEAQKAALAAQVVALTAQLRPEPTD